MSSRVVTTKRPYIRGTAADRFNARLLSVGDCIEWQGSRDRKGYGRFNAGTGREPRYVLAHRFAMELVGQLTNLPLLHSCDNPPCCNVEHLTPGTLGENNADMRRKGRQARGERQGNAKLAEGGVRQLRLRFDRGEPLAALAHEFGIAYRTAYDVIRGVTWKHVDQDGKEIKS